METYFIMLPMPRCIPTIPAKGDYLYRLDGLNRAFEAGIDDVGLGVLFGLYDWRFEVLAMVRHALYPAGTLQCRSPYLESFRACVRHTVSSLMKSISPPTTNSNGSSPFCDWRFPIPALF
ncbi:MAG: hypothetical protein R2864_15110 [Syntrophotaleaceae bacterium]